MRAVSEMNGEARPVPFTTPRELLRSAEKSHWIQAWYQNSLQVVNRGKLAIAVWVRPLLECDEVAEFFLDLNKFHQEW